YQHITAYASFTVAGLADLLTEKGVLPAAADRMALAFAFFIPAFLFLLHGSQVPVSLVVHLILGFLLLAGGILTLVEQVRPAPFVRWTRIYLVLLAGTWLIQLGWLLFVSGYDMESEATVVRTYLLFSWHAVFDGALLLAALSPRWRAHHYSHS